MSKERLKFIDLFCGCGGFSLGMRDAGLLELAAIDSDPMAVQTFKSNFPSVPNVLERDLTGFGPEQLDDVLSQSSNNGLLPAVDVIVGGPPCQGFSNARRRDGSNHGHRLKDDNRRDLYQEFLAYVAYFQPRVFVMENVLGIRSAAGGEFFARVQSDARRLGYRVHGEVVCAWRYGVPQKRVRQFIVGTRRELPIFTMERFMGPTHRTAEEPELDGLEPATTLWEAIGDLPPLEAGSGWHKTGYDPRRRQSQVAKFGGRYIRSVLKVHRATVLTGHVSRPHSERDLRDFRLLLEGESSAIAMRERSVRFEWPYSKAHFKDRYTRQHRNRLCSTIVAHLAKDGLMFIHPTQCRSLTPREAARVQSFPDYFEFPEARTCAFRLIGNAVPPLIGKAVGRTVRRYLKYAEQVLKRRLRDLVPCDERQALEWLLPLLRASAGRSLEAVAADDFRLGWAATGFLCFGLHPDAAEDNGTRVGPPTADLEMLRAVSPELAEHVFVSSGWPELLVPIAGEARRRFKAQLLRRDEYYFSSAQAAAAFRFERRKMES